MTWTYNHYYLVHFKSSLVFLILICSCTAQDGRSLKLTVNVNTEDNNSSETDGEPSSGSSGCGGGKTDFNIISDSEPLTLQSPHFNQHIGYPLNSECSYTVTGTGCRTQFQVLCPDMDIRKSDKCGEEYVKIVDHQGTAVTLCGKTRMGSPKKSPSNKAFKLTFKSASSDKNSKFYKGWTCEFKCVDGSKPNEKATTVDPYC